MKNLGRLALAIAVVAAPVAVSTPAVAQYSNYGGGYTPPPPPPPPAQRYDDRQGDYGRQDSYARQGDYGRQGDYAWRGDSDDRRWEPSQHYRDRDRRVLGSNDRVYRGNDGRYYCKRSDGTTGLVLGALGGGVIGNVLGGGTLGTVLGAGGGALLGRSLDRRNDDAQNRRNGYYCD